MCSSGPAIEGDKLRSTALAVFKEILSDLSEYDSTYSVEVLMSHLM